jgi:1-deoxy-D-xylulose-5-phosphate synthase
LGPLAHAAARASDILAGEGILADVYSLRFATPLDARHLAEICGDYESIVTVEDGIISGGVGEALRASLSEFGVQASVHALGFKSQPLAQAGRMELLAQAGLDESGLVDYVSHQFPTTEIGGSHETIAVAAGE